MKNHRAEIFRLGQKSLDYLWGPLHEHSEWFYSGFSLLTQDG